MQNCSQLTTITRLSQLLRAATLAFAAASIGGGGGKLVAQTWEITTAYEEIDAPYTGPSVIELKRLNHPFAQLCIKDGASFTSSPDIILKPGELWFDRDQVLTFGSTINGPSSTAIQKTGTGEVHLTGSVKVDSIVVSGGTLSLESPYEVWKTIWIDTNSTLIVAADTSDVVWGIGHLNVSGTLHLESPLASPNGVLLLAAYGGVVKNTGVLSGFGTVTRDYTLDIQNSATVSPGGAGPANRIGILRFENTNGDSISLASGAKYVVDLNGASKKSDLLSSLGGNIAIASGALLEISDIANKDKVRVGDQFTIAEIASGGAGDIVGTFDPTPFEFQGIEFTVEKLDANGIAVSGANDPGKTLVLRVLRAPQLVTPVPEPSTYALFGGLGALAFALWRRNRRKAA